MSVLRDAVVDIDDDGRITHVGPADTAPATDAPVTRVSGLLMPGLVNTHAHTPLTVLRGMGGDLPLMRWLLEVVWPAEAKLDGADVRAGMLAGTAEMLRGGVTTSAEMYFQSEHVVEAVLEIGSRVVLTPGIITAPGMERLGTWQQMRDAITRWIDADGLRFGPGERIELGYGPHAAYTLPTEAIVTTAALARERGALMQLHVAEAMGEDDDVRAEFGSVPAMLEATGSLGGRVLAAHAIQLSDDDIAILARHDVAVAHCPGSNAKLAAGVGAGGRAAHRRRPDRAWAPTRRPRTTTSTCGRSSASPRCSPACAAPTPPRSPPPTPWPWPPARGAARSAATTSASSRPAPGPTSCTSASTTRPSSTPTTTPSSSPTSSGPAAPAGVRDVWVAGEPVLTDGALTRVDPGDVLAGARRVATKVKSLTVSEVPGYSREDRSRSPNATTRDAATTRAPATR